MVPSFREEFRCKNVLPSHTREELFYLPQWRVCPLLFVFYRLMVATYVDVNILIGAVNYGKSSQQFTWFVYLTNWSYFVLASHLTLAALIAVLHNIEDSGPGCCQPHRKHTEDLINEDELVEGDLGYHGYSIPWYMKLNWILYSIIINIAIAVTIIYFSFLYPETHSSGDQISYENLNYHAFNTVIALLEVFINSIPVRVLHFVYPLLFGTCYMLFSVIYWAYDHSRVIYPEILDWNKPGQTVAFVLVTGLVASPIIQLCLYAIYRLRLALFRRCY